VNISVHTLQGHLNPLTSFNQKKRDLKEIELLLISWK